ncbi:hypothetical protein [Domibacillus robiginosus]|uniref:hypothetical protein n=1 Tax=Domibacillus robiginosus TaxID=1071054 RepID=UPI00067BF17D|nr:hypothetical protein [Domibacillus robiginosus]
MNSYKIIVLDNAAEQKDTIMCTLFIMDEENVKVLHTEGFQVKTETDRDTYVEKATWRFLRCI